MDNSTQFPKIPTPNTECQVRRCGQSTIRPLSCSSFNVCMFFFFNSRNNLLPFRSNRSKTRTSGTLSSADFQTAPGHTNENIKCASESSGCAVFTPLRRSSKPLKLVSEVNKGQSLAAARPSRGWRASLATGRDLLTSLGWKQQGLTL